MDGKLIGNTLPALIDLAAQGLGLVNTFTAYCQAQISSGVLVPVLDEHLPETPGVFIYFPREYRSMMPLRLLLEHLKQSFAVR